MNLWLVDEKQFVIADGPAGALYLSGGNYARLIFRGIEKVFRPKLITVDEARKFLDKHQLEKSQESKDESISK